MTALMVFVIVLLTTTLIVLVVGMLLYIQRLNKVVAEIEKTLAVLRKEIPSLAAEIRRAASNADHFFSSGRIAIDRTKRVAESAERLLEGKTITRVAEAAVSGSRAGIISAIEGIREGLRTLRSSRKEANGTDNDSTG